jgi:carboxyvinyl-carboxyphosphonate phosphorylmutase
MEEGVGKMKAALSGRQDANLVVAGRTSALRLAGVGETVRRVSAYERAGVDAIFLAGAQTLEELRAVRSATSLPLLLGGTTPELSDRAVLAENGVRVALQGHLPFQAAVKAVYDTLRALREGADPADLAPNAASQALMARSTRQADHDRWIEEFLG